MQLSNGMTAMIAEVTEETVLLDGNHPLAGEALTFGKRGELLEIARQRIYQNPGEYVSHIYGEHEVGGTGYIYLSAVPFDQIGFRTDLGKQPYPEYTKEFLYSVPVVFLLVPTLLAGLHRLSNDRARS